MSIRSNQRTLSRRSFLWNGLIFIPSVAIAQAQIRPRIRGGRIIPATGGGGASLQFVTSGQSAWTTATNSVTTGSFSVVSGDVLILCACNEDNGASGAYNTPTNTGTAFTWTNQFTTNTGSSCKMSWWKATASASQSMTATITTANSGVRQGVIVLVFRNCSATGTAVNTTAGGSSPSLAVTTAAANSMIVSMIADFNAVDGGTRTWRTINSITPTSGNGAELVYQTSAGHYTVYCAYYSDAGSAASKTTGMTAPSGQAPTMGAIEIKA